MYYEHTIVQERKRSGTPSVSFKEEVQKHNAREDGIWSDLGKPLRGSFELSQ